MSEMFDDINKIIENNITDTDLVNFCVIIGSNPSQGARSPILWNKVFSAEKKKVKMLPLDVKPENVGHLFYCLQEHPQCLGGAVAVPYKEKIFDLTKKHLSKEVSSIGAINCFFRKDTSLKSAFMGTNTDGEAALDPILQILDTKEKMNIALMGIGGAGKAVLAFLHKKFGAKHKIHIFNRTSRIDFKNKEIVISKITYFENSISDFDLIINATSAGSSTDLDSTPFNLNLLKYSKPSCLVYDIIYDPLKTSLLNQAEERGLATINGLKMNLIQAVLAYKYTSKTSLTLQEIYETMNN